MFERFGAFAARRMSSLAQRRVLPELSCENLPALPS